MVDWSTESDNQLREWRSAGFSYELISRKLTALGFKRSKMSVIGRAARLGLINRIKKTPRFSVQKQYRQPIASGAALFEKIKASRPAAAVLPTPTAAGEFLGLGLMELEPYQCRYPEGHGSEIRFCGQPQQEGSSYCPTHHRLCNVKTKALT